MDYIKKILKSIEEEVIREEIAGVSNNDNSLGIASLNSNPTNLYLNIIFCASVQSWVLSGIRLMIDCDWTD